MTTYNCTICPFSTTSPLGIQSHARKHRNRFEELVGRPPEDYGEVRALLVDGEIPDDVELLVGRRTTLEEWST
jgi:hypothetical protein